MTIPSDPAVTRGRSFREGPLARWRPRLQFDRARLGQHVSGPLLTMVTAIVLDLLTRHGAVLGSPFPLLLLTVFWAGLRGGLGSATISALVAVLYAVHFFAEPGPMFHYSPAGWHGLAIVAVSAPGAALMAALMPHRVPVPRELRAEERLSGGSEAERRALLVADADALLADAETPEAAMQGLARLVVPTLADWCALHLVGPDGGVVSAAVADRDPAREAELQQLRSWVPAVLSPGRPLDAAVAQLQPAVENDQLDRLAGDRNHRALLERFGVRSHAVVPLVVRGRLFGALTALTAAPRTLTTTDLFYLQQLGRRAAGALDRSRLGEEADAARQRARLLFDGNPQPMWMFEVESLAILAVNDAAVRHYGYSREEFLAMTIMDLRPADDDLGAPPASEWASEGRGQVALTQHRRRDGSVVDVEVMSHEIQLGPRRARLVQVVDVTDRARTRAALHRSEEHLRQAQKLDAMGRLAGGVAHDFNDLLTEIEGYSGILLRSASPDDPRRGDLVRILEAAERGAILTRRLLAFGGRQTLEPQPVDLNELLRGMESLLQRLVGAEIQLAVLPAPGLGRIKGDPGQIEQVILNLVLNARDAMPQGGQLTIEATARNVRRTGRSRQMRPGRYIVVAVSDTGMGMDDVVRARLFEPFFTTKGAGGSGLGMSIVYGIVKQSGGTVRIATEPGSGTTVKVYLPRWEGAETGVIEDDVPAPVSATRTVLLVEDEESVRELLRKVLAGQGYRVLEARHGRDALLTLEEHPGTIDVVVTDVVMPEMNGRELVAQLTARRPGVPVLFISGYASGQLDTAGELPPGHAFLAKPFSTEELVRRVGALLAERDATA